MVYFLGFSFFFLYLCRDEILISELEAVQYAVKQICLAGDSVSYRYVKPVWDLGCSGLQGHLEHGVTNTVILRNVFFFQEHFQNQAGTSHLLLTGVMSTLLTGGRGNRSDAVYLFQRYSLLLGNALHSWVIPPKTKRIFFPQTLYFSGFRIKYI